MLMVHNEKAATIIKKGDEAYINGVLGKKFYKRFKKFIKENPEIKTIVFEEVPGSINDEWNVKSCVLLHQSGFNTRLTSNSMIASGGVDLFISGNKRYIEKGAKIGVHSWSDGKKDGADYPRDDEGHQIFFDMFEKINMDTAFYWFTLRAAPAESIHFMTEEEIELYQLKKDIQK